MTTSLQWIQDCIRFKHSRIWPPQEPNEPILMVFFTAGVFAWILGVGI